LATITTSLIERIRTRVIRNDRISHRFGHWRTIGVIALLVLLILWLISFGTAFVLGFIFGTVYNDTVESLPFVSGLAKNIKDRLTNHTN